MTASMTARRNGFTLLELLVALTVLGLIMVGIVEGIGYGIKSWDSQARQLDATAELDGIDRVLRELAHGISPLRNNGFAGQHDRLSFTGRLPLAMPASRRAADLTLIVSGDHRLLLRWTPHRHAVSLVAPRVAEVELLRTVQGVEFGYWPAPYQGGGWRTALADTVPSLIRLHIVFMPGDPRHWPDLIAAPMITAPFNEL
jgi:general secretion pathway protein J